MDVCFRGVVVLTIVTLFVGCGDKQTSSAGTQFIKSGREDCETQRVQGEYLVRWKSGKLEVVRSESDAVFVEEYLDMYRDEIHISEPHYQVTQQTQVVERGWGGDINWGVYAVGADKVWQQQTHRSEVIVAVIDSGMETTHPQLQGAMAVNLEEELNGLDDDGNGLIDDRFGYDFAEDTAEVVDTTGHGTHVSGIIAAQHELGPILGVAPWVKILPLAFIGRNGGGSVANAISAIQYAVQRGAKVINASWGGEVCSLLLKEEIAATAESDVLFVVAAGNSGVNLSMSPEYPAAFEIENMITVGASTFDNKTAAFSNYGPLVDLVAPGANISSTFPYSLGGEGILNLEGTSMATPFVSAAAAMLKSISPDASFAEIKQAIIRGVRPGPFPVETRGQLDIPMALEMLTQGNNTPFN